MNKISWFSLNNLDESGELWYSQGYYNAGINTIKALQEKKTAVKEIISANAPGPIF